MLAKTTMDGEHSWKGSRLVSQNTRLSKKGGWCSGDTCVLPARAFTSSAATSRTTERTIAQGDQ